MKKLISSIVSICMYSLLHGQVFPEGIPYQAQVFSSTGSILSNTTIGVQFNIHSATMTGTIVWQETHSVTVNEVGHFAVVIGQGTSTGTGTTPAFENIDWASGIYFLEMLIDENNTGAYVTTMTQQLMAVPFAYHAKTTSQEYQLSELLDVDTSGIQVGDILEWDGTKWVPGADDFTANSDTAQFAFESGTAIYSDTAYYAQNCIQPSLVDSTNFAYMADTALFVNTGFQSIYSDSTNYADTAGVTLYSLGNWGLNGNDNINSNNFLGTTDSVDLIIKSNDTERMRILANGRIGFGTSSPLTDYHVNNNNGVLFTGNFGSGTIPTQGSGTRMMWYPGKAAFRSGYVSGGNWDDGLIGNYSFSSGYNTIASGEFSVAFGFTSQATGEGAFAVGNAALSSGSYSVSLGHNPTASGEYSIALGRGALASDTSAIAIGYHPTASSPYSLSLGNYTSAIGINSVAMGYHSWSLHDGSFIYADQSDPFGYVETTAPNQFMVRAVGGSVFYTSSDLSTGVSLPAGGGAWSTLSDSTVKENIVHLNPMDYYALIDSIEVYKWNYKSQDSSIQHIGPMAQDFYATFGLGLDSTTINSGDFDGVNLLLLKALYLKIEEVEDQSQEIEILNAEIEDLKRKREELTMILIELEEKVEHQNREDNSSSIE